MRSTQKMLVCLFCVAACLALAAPCGAAEKGQPKKSVSEQILEILLERKIVSQEKYDELKSQVVAERADAAAAAKRGYDIKYRPAKGVAIVSNDGQNSVALTGRLQIDGKAFTKDTGDNSSFYIRRARLAAAAKWHKYYSALVEAEFGKGKARLNDAYLNIGWWKSLQFKFGQFKQPFSMEELHSDNWIWTIERSLINSLAPSRDIGLMTYGELGQGTAYWYLALSNGQGKNETNDQNEGKDIAGRFVVAPLRHTGNSLFRDLYVGGSATWGDQDSTASDWWNGGKLITPTSNTWFLVNGDVLQDGLRTRYGAEIFWSYGPFGFMGELVKADFAGLELNSVKRDLSIWGGYAQATWMITGEHPGYAKGKPASIQPERAFGLGPGEGWGAWQLVLRYDKVEADSDWRNLGFVNSSDYADGAQGWILGINWYLNDMTHFMLDFFDYTFDQDVLIKSTRVDGEQGFLGRIQLIF